jgi:hypothetical protein
MKNTDTPISNEMQLKSAVDELEELLREQLGLARKGNINEMEILADKTHKLIKQISESKFIAGRQFKERRNNLERLYSQICLALSVQMDDVSQALDKIYRGKKTITLYRDNI